MAIDTEDKRFSMLSWHHGRKVPQPDGAIDQNDRQTLLGRYGGILWGLVVGLTPDERIFKVIAETRSKTIIAGQRIMKVASETRIKTIISEARTLIIQLTDRTD